MTVPLIFDSQFCHDERSAKHPLYCYQKELITLAVRGIKKNMIKIMISLSFFIICQNSLTLTDCHLITQYLREKLGNGTKNNYNNNHLHLTNHTNKFSRWKAVIRWKQLRSIHQISR
jgi:hypothetical protein